MSEEKTDRELAHETCIIELLHIAKPLKHSCFSEQQIDLLFHLWREFMYQRFAANEPAERAIQEVDQLFSLSTSTAQKYDALRLDSLTGVKGQSALPQHEQAWVMGSESPTPFIEFLRLRPDVIEELSMSFKPILLHNGVLEPADLINVMERFRYWLQNDTERSVNLLGVDTPVEVMSGNLSRSWSSFRFHVALMSEQKHWRALLIDKRSRTFEWYDPLGHPVDMSSSQLRELFETARALEPSLLTQSVQTVRRGFHKHQRGGTECGMYVLFFIHSRVVLKKTFEEFVDTAISGQTCKDLKPVFFTIPRVSVEDRKNKDFRLQYGDYDIRLAGLEFARYVEYVIQILTPSDPVATPRLQSDRNTLREMILGPGDHQEIRAQGLLVQRDILQSLPPQFRTYTGSDIWFNTIQQVVQDPLTVHLRKVSKGQRGSATKREAEAGRILSQVIGWSFQLGAPPENVALLNDFMAQQISTVYVPVLQFKNDNRSKFVEGMTATAFVRQCMARLETVGFGVHFLREVAEYVRTVLLFRISSDLDGPYAPRLTVAKPVSVSNLDEITSVVNHCDTVMQQAYELLQSAFTERMGLSALLSTTGIPLSPWSPSTFAAASPTRSIQEQLQTDLQMKQLDGDQINHPRPWWFPINLTEYNQLSAVGNDQDVRAPEDRFWNYSLTADQMRTLLNTREFLLDYAAALMEVVSALKYQRVTRLQTIFLATVSLSQFFAATTHPDTRTVLCQLVKLLHKAITNAISTGGNLGGKSRSYQLSQLLTSVLDPINARCESEPMMTSPSTQSFLTNAVARYDAQRKKGDNNNKQQ